jgi:hypothetical protein
MQKLHNKLKHPEIDSKRANLGAILTNHQSYKQIDPNLHLGIFCSFLNISCGARNSSWTKVIAHLR